MIKPKIYTSYFAKADKLRAQGIIPVGICFKPPSYFSGKNLKELAPDAETFKIGKGTNNALYTKRFNELLESRNFEGIAESINQISEENDGKPIALCCYETVKDFCHRHLVADYLRAHGVDVQEAFFKKSDQGVIVKRQQQYREQTGE